MKRIAKLLKEFHDIALDLEGWPRASRQDRWEWQPLDRIRAGVCLSASTVYSISLASVQGFFKPLLSSLMKSKKRLNKTAENGIFLLKGKELLFSHLNLAIPKGPSIFAQPEANSNRVTTKA